MLEKIVSKKPQFKVGQEVLVQMCSFGGPEITEKGIVQKYLGREDRFDHRIKPSQAEHKYLVKLSGDSGHANVYQSDLKSA